VVLPDLHGGGSSRLTAAGGFEIRGPVKMGVILTAPQRYPSAAFRAFCNASTVSGFTLLAMNGHECRIALDGKAALSLDTAFRPTVAIFDIGLPDMSGFDVAVSLRERFKTEPLTLIALSGYAMAEFHKEAIEAGFDYYFAKPVPIDKLFDLLETFPDPKQIASI
jgi:CheY-like chemotaxis protein